MKKNLFVRERAHIALLFINKRTEAVEIQTSKPLPRYSEDTLAAWEGQFKEAATGAHLLHAYECIVAGRAEG